MLTDNNLEQLRTCRKQLKAGIIDIKTIGSLLEKVELMTAGKTGDPPGAPQQPAIKLNEAGKPIKPRRNLKMARKAEMIEWLIQHH